MPLDYIILDDVGCSWKAQNLSYERILEASDFPEYQTGQTSMNLIMDPSFDLLVKQFGPSSYTWLMEILDQSVN